MSGSHERFGSVDPAPELKLDEAGLAARLLDARQPVFERMRALFGLRSLATPAAVEAIGRCLRTDGSALIRHEAAYIFGQMQEPLSIPHLAHALETDPNPMVRHESAESLGNMPAEHRGATRKLLERALTADASIEVRESCEVALANLDYLADEKQFEL